LLSLILFLCLGFGLSANAYYPYGDYHSVHHYNYNMPMQQYNLVEANSEIKPAKVAKIKYIVQAGDTLYRISRNFDVTVTTLVKENSLTNPDLLLIGQELVIPESEAETEVKLPDINEKLVKKVLTSTLTAYTAGKESTGKTPSHPEYGITFSGSKAKEGRTIAVDPSVIPMGTTVYIEGIGIRTAEDTGSAIRGARIDIFMNDLKQALHFGVKKNVKVYVLS
jgi:3D (Asp-Asp-Asp) domain-containing protein